MDMMMRLGALFTAATTFRLTLAIPTIAIKGSKFFDSNGNQFYIKGVSVAQHITSSAEKWQAWPTKLSPT